MVGIPVERTAGGRKWEGQPPLGPLVGVPEGYAWKEFGIIVGGCRSGRVRGRGGEGRGLERRLWDGRKWLPNKGSPDGLYGPTPKNPGGTLD